MPSPVSEVREFNRFYTATIGVLGEGLLRTPYSLTEARVLFELAQREATEVTALRRELRLDAGYLSRILARFAVDGLVERSRSVADGRRQVIRLTPSGYAAFRVLDERSGKEIQRLLDGLPITSRRRLLDAMTTIRGVLTRTDPPAVTLRGPRPGDLGWVVARHGELYAAEHGWDASFEALVAGIVAEFSREGGDAGQRAWIAEVDGTRAGCVFCMRDDEWTARLRVLLVEPDARGTGIGGRLVTECVEFARGAGYRRMVLLTYDMLAQARRLYQRAGFRLTSSEPARRYGHDLVEQEWTLEL